MSCCLPTAGVPLPSTVVLGLKLTTTHWDCNVKIIPQHGSSITSLLASTYIRVVYVPFARLLVPQCSDYHMTTCLLSPWVLTDGLMLVANLPPDQSHCPQSDESHIIFTVPYIIIFYICFLQFKLFIHCRL